MLGEYDPAMKTVENLRTLAPLLEQFDNRERLIAKIRFGAEMTQAQIGAKFGISQMHLSRLLTRTVR